MVCLLHRATIITAYRPNTTQAGILLVLNVKYDLREGSVCG